MYANLVSYAFLWWRVGEWGAAREGNTKISGIGLEPDVSWPMSAGIGTRLNFNVGRRLATQN